MALPIPSYLLSALPSGRGCIALKNRMLVAPLTRARSGPSRVPSLLNVEHYRQRAGFGLIISEATAISPQGFGWKDAPGIYTPEMVTGWRAVTDAVHEAGGTIFCQLWHMGRQSHSSHQEGGAQIVSASAIGLPGDVTTATGEKAPYELPRPLETAELAGVVAQYKTAAANAKLAGFDGVEVHGANGYLLDQFLQSCSNKRTDAYGGSLENRYRLLDEVVRAITAVYSVDRIAVRLSPNGAFGGMGSDDNAAAFTYFASRLAELKVGILHVMDGLGFGAHAFDKVSLFDMKVAFKGGIVAGNVGFTRESADGAVRSGAADLIAFGRPSILNPDLPQLFAEGKPQLPDAPYDVWWNFAKGAEGYTEYNTFA